MMLIRSQDRGFADHGWLKSYHTFSFADFFEPKQMGFKSLRVINDDYIEAKMGFGTHPHRDMEIITCVTHGALEHKDSMGNGSVIYPGDVQYMSAGKGVTHSEFNHSQNETTHLFQIWILPNQRGASPRYDQKNFSAVKKKNQLCLLASSDGASGSIQIRQQAKLMASILDAGKNMEYKAAYSGLYVHLIRGQLDFNGHLLSEGDGIGLEATALCHFTAKGKEAEFLLFDLQ